MSRFFDRRDQDDRNYETFLKLRKEGQFDSFPPSWLAVIQFEQLISVVESYEQVEKIPQFEDGNTLIQPITDRPPIHIPSVW